MRAVRVDTREREHGRCAVYVCTLTSEVDEYQDRASGLSFGVYRPEASSSDVSMIPLFLLVAARALCLSRLDYRPEKNLGLLGESARLYLIQDWCAFAALVSANEANH